jgi:Mn-dependent DtxR family transcriptional regulator
LDKCWAPHPALGTPAMRLPIPDDIRRFLLTSVPSVPYLEAMLLLRAGGRPAWALEDVARRLYVSQQKAEELVRQLSEAGFVTAPEQGQIEWRPPEELRGLVDEVARLYAEELVAVTELIHTRQERRARQFADAFLLRKKEP